MPIDEWDPEDRVETTVLSEIEGFLAENPGRAYTALDVAKAVVDRMPAGDFSRREAEQFAVLLDVLVDRGDVVRLERLGTVYYTVAD